jgi:hypothetical protein
MLLERSRTGFHATIDITEREVDVPLSRRGEEQAAAVGRWFATLPEAERPTVLLSSPCLRARRTAEAICEAGGLLYPDDGLVLDERLREREFGILDRLTWTGIQARQPDQAEFRRRRWGSGVTPACACPIHRLSLSGSVPGSPRNKRSARYCSSSCSSLNPALLCGDTADAVVEARTPRMMYPVSACIAASARPAPTG